MLPFELDSKTMSENKEQIDRIAQHGWGRPQRDLWNNALAFDLLSPGSVYPGPAVTSVCAPFVWAVFQDLERVAYATRERCRLSEGDTALGDWDLTEAFGATVYLHFLQQVGDLEWVAAQLTRLKKQRRSKGACLVASVCLGLGAAAKEHPTLIERKWLLRRDGESDVQWSWGDLADLEHRFAAEYASPRV